MKFVLLSAHVILLVTDRIGSLSHVLLFDWFVLIIAAKLSAERSYIAVLLVFYNSKGAVFFFKICSHIFMISEVKLE